VKRKLAAILVLTTALVLSTFATFSVARPAAAAYDDPDDPKTVWPIDGVPTSYNDNVVVKWDDELLQTIRANPAATGPTVTSRAIAVLHTAIYDAWAAYVPVADGVHYHGKATDPASDESKQKAISFAAHDTLVWLFQGLPPSQNRTNDYKLQMDELGYSLGDPSEPAQIGRLAAQATITYRGDDNSNQANSYADPCLPKCYEAQNDWNRVDNPWAWQPLCIPLPAPGATSCSGTVQKPYTPHWKNVKSFALTDPQQFMPPGPPKLANGLYDPKDVDTALRDTSNLDDTKKVMAEYWADGPKSEFPPGHWALLAQALSRKRAHTLDTDVKLFFVIGNAVLDAGISSWAAKYEHDFARPITAIRARYAGTLVNSWRGPYQGYGMVDGSQWRPYQAPNVVTPPFPEYTSGHSTFSGAARIAIIAFTGTDTFNGQVTIKAGHSLFESGAVPARDVVLKWKTFLAAADQAGMSRRYGGIHFESGDRHGRANGASVGYQVYDRAKRHWEGKITP
jgi:hypothetical protein